MWTRPETTIKELTRSNAFLFRSGRHFPGLPAGITFLVKAHDFTVVLRGYDRPEVDKSN